jgi:signal transduction histidine kinase
VFGRYGAQVGRDLVRRLGGWPGDIVVAAGVATLGVVETVTNSLIVPKSAAWPCEIAIGVVLVARRHFPLAVLVAVAVAGTAQALAGVPTDQPWVPLAALMIATYSLVTRVSLERSMIGMLVLAMSLAVQVIDQHKGFGNFAFGVAFVAPIFVLARTMRHRVDQAVRRSELEELRAAAAVEAERRRIARELHDVISHSLGIVVLQAGAAQQVVDRNPELARELLESIRLTGLEAVGELGTLLSLVRVAPSDDLEPAPRLADLDRLVERMRAAGLAVDLHRDGPPRPLPAALELSAYRIVQEGLTNALKHASGAHVQVRVTCSDHALNLEVTDDGSGGVPTQRGTRHGLVGVGERVAVFGGRVDVGPRGDGWALRASFPLPS